MHRHTLRSDGSHDTVEFIMPWHKFVAWYVHRKWSRLKAPLSNPRAYPAPKSCAPRPVFALPSQDNVADRFLKAIGRSDNWMPIAEAVAAVDRMDDIERIGLWYDWMIDEALWCSMPVIEDGFDRPFLWHRKTPRMTLAEFFTPRGSKYNDPHLTPAHDYYRMARSCSLA